MIGLQPSDIIDKVDSLSGVPTIAVKILSLLESRNVSASDIEKFILMEPGITANIIKLINSPYFGLPSKVASIRQALVLLGFKRISHLIISICMKSLLDKPVEAYGLDPEGLWLHSVTTSIISEIIIEELSMEYSDELFTAALLHDIGKFILGKFIKEDIKAIEDLSVNHGVPFERAEQMILGFDHAEIGALILKKWRFPENIINSVRWHHSPESSSIKDDIIVDTVHIANLLALMVGQGAGRDGIFHAPSSMVIKKMKLKPFHLERICSKAIDLVDEFNLFLGETA